MTTNQLEVAPPKRWLTTADYKNEYGVSRQTQYRQRRAGKIPYTQAEINGVILYDRYKIDELLESNSVNIESQEAKPN